MNNINQGENVEGPSDTKFNTNNPSCPSTPSLKNNKKVKFNSIIKLRKYEDINSSSEGSNTNANKEILYLNIALLTNLSYGKTASKNKLKTAVNINSSSINLENKPGRVEEKKFYSRI